MLVLETLVKIGMPLFRTKNVWEKMGLPLFRKKNGEAATTAYRDRDWDFLNVTPLVFAMAGNNVCVCLFRQM